MSNQRKVSSIGELKEYLHLQASLGGPIFLRAQESSEDNDHLVVWFADRDVYQHGYRSKHNENAEFLIARGSQLLKETELTGPFTLLESGSYHEVRLSGVFREQAMCLLQKNGIVLPPNGCLYFENQTIPLPNASVKLRSGGDEGETRIELESEAGQVIQVPLGKLSCREQVFYEDYVLRKLSAYIQAVSSTADQAEQIRLCC